eukprot:m.81777 g.81777  ORF g.81777 m.81777 type:complete len:269 (-) comp19501_c0_seq2:3589-4395(-)
MTSHRYLLVVVSQWNSLTPRKKEVSKMAAVVEAGGEFEAARKSFNTVGHSVCRGVIPTELTDRVSVGVEELVASPHGGILVHKEKLADGSIKPARIERFVLVPGPLEEANEVARKAAEKVTGRRLNTFKDKVNFKYPGGGTFKPHQDSPAYYPHGNWHVSVLLPLTPFNGENGTLEVADTLPKAVPMSDLEAISYEPVMLGVGDILVFDGLVPHQSGHNKTSKPRIGMYLTFTDVEAGDVSGPYYAAKAAGIDGMSLNQVDFTGNLVK